MSSNFYNFMISISFYYCSYGFRARVHYNTSQWPVADLRFLLFGEEANVFKNIIKHIKSYFFKNTLLIIMNKKCINLLVTILFV